MLTPDCRSLSIQAAAIRISNGGDEPILPTAWLRLSQAGKINAAGGNIERVFHCPPNALLDRDPVSLLELDPVVFGTYWARAQKEGATTFRVGRLEVNVSVSESDTILFIRDAEPVQRLIAAFMAQDRLAALGQATITTAHDINNTLTAIDSVIPLLEHPGLADVERRKHIANLKKEAAQATRIIGELVNLGREWRNNVETIPVHELVRDALALHKQALHCTQIETKIVVPQDDAPVIVGRRTQIEIALHQLIANAIQALNHPQVKTRTIQLQVERFETNQAQIMVQDTGPGIDPVILPHLFERFATTSPNRPGLGLWIAKRLIEDNDGSIELGSLAAGRTTFIIRLPIVTSQPPEQLSQNDDERPQFEQLQAMMGLRILIVDDNQTLRDNAARILRLYGPELVVEAATAAEALQAIQEGPGLFEIVLLDIRLPDGNGRDTYYEILRIAPELASGIIFMVGERIEGEMKAFLETTQVPYLAKPFQIPDLIRAIGQVAATRRAKRSNKGK